MPVTAIAPPWQRQASDFPITKKPKRGSGEGARCIRLDAYENYVIADANLCAYNNCATKAPIIDSTKDVLRYPRKVRSNAIRTYQYHSMSNIDRPRPSKYPGR